jgi:hypothetical protein
MHTVIRVDADSQAFAANSAQTLPLNVKQNDAVSAKLAGPKR